MRSLKIANCLAKEDILDDFLMRTVVLIGILMKNNIEQNETLNIFTYFTSLQYIY